MAPIVDLLRVFVQQSDPILLSGPTGVGKTEMAKALARFYSASKKLKTYTLGNCVEPHSVATIIGVPPGYVGHDQGGRLVNEMNADPYCVFLLDEADKAHPEVWRPFLNLFDEGWVVDQRGVRAADHQRDGTVGRYHPGVVQRVGRDRQQVDGAEFERPLLVETSKQEQVIN